MPAAKKPLDSGALVVVVHVCILTVNFFSFRGG